MDLDPQIVHTLITILMLIFIKTALTWIIAIKLEEFDIREAPRFLITNVTPYVAGLIILALPSLWIPQVKVLYYTVVATVGAKYLAEITDRINVLFDTSIDVPENIAT